MRYTEVRFFEFIVWEVQTSFFRLNSMTISWSVPVDMIQQGCLFWKPEFIMLIIVVIRSMIQRLIRLFTGYNYLMVAFVWGVSWYLENQTNCFQIIDYRIDGYEHLIRQRILWDRCWHFGILIMMWLIRLSAEDPCFSSSLTSIFSSSTCLSLFDLKALSPQRAFHDDLSIKAG